MDAGYTIIDPVPKKKTKKIGIFFLIIQIGNVSLKDLSNICLKKVFFVIHCDFKKKISK